MMESTPCGRGGHEFDGSGWCKYCGVKRADKCAEAPQSSEKPKSIGQVYNFGIGDGNHICKVQIVDIEKTTEGEMLYYICRRINNGSIVLAFEEDLKP